MADTKRNFLYEFNRTLRSIYSESALIESVFENIDNGKLRLSPNEFVNPEFLSKTEKLVFILKKILASPYKTVSGVQTIVPTSEAKSANHESVRLTMADPSLWSIKDGKRTPTYAYTIINEDVFTNYENAFICQLIKLLLMRLKMIRIDVIRVSGKTAVDFENGNAEGEYLEIYTQVTSLIKKLSRISKQKLFADNSAREVDLSNIFVTDIIMHDKRYNFCYRFFIQEMKNKQVSVTATKDFRVLYHNYALVHILYGLYKEGFKFDGASYRIPVSGKVVINTIEIKKGKDIAYVSRSKNGIDISCGDESVHIEFSKASLTSVESVKRDFESKSEKLGAQHPEFYIAYPTSYEEIDDKIVSLGYKAPQSAVDKLIKAI